MATKTSSITEPYFSHDISSRQDKDIILLIDEMGFEGYGLFWAVVEFMHRNKLNVGEERLVVGKAYADKIERILNDFNLFRIENDEYISDRILANISKQEEKSKKASSAASAKWALSALKKAYLEVFEVEPCLKDEEIKNFLKYFNKFSILKDRLKDVLYTLKKLKFENNKDFTPSINWLLESNNLTKLINGAWGELRNWQAHKDYIAQQKKEKEQTLRGLNDTRFDINSVSSKADAIELVLTNSTFIDATNRLVINPEYSGLVKKFDLSMSELCKAKLERINDGK